MAKNVQESSSLLSVGMYPVIRETFLPYNSRYKSGIDRMCNLLSNPLKI